MALKHGHQRDLERELGKLRYKAAGVDGDTITFTHEDSRVEPLRVKKRGSGDPNALRMTVRSARQRIQNAEQANARFVQWILDEYGVGPYDRVVLKTNKDGKPFQLVDEVRRFLFSTGLRGVDPLQIQSYVGKRKTTRITREKDGTWVLVGPLYGTEPPPPETEEQEEPEMATPLPHSAAEHTALVEAQQRPMNGTPPHPAFPPELAALAPMLQTMQDALTKDVRERAELAETRAALGVEGLREALDRVVALEQHAHDVGGYIKSLIATLTERA